LRIGSERMVDRVVASPVLSRSILASNGLGEGLRDGAHPAQRLARVDAAHADETVHVTIDRLVIKAPAAASARLATPKMGLRAYLQQRRGGR
jgi:hypothetical protein